MVDALNRVMAVFAVTSPWELLAAILALVYVIFAVKKSMWCWLAAIISSGIYVALMAASRLYMEAVLNVFYVAMALYGYWEWRRGRDSTGDVAVTHWRRRDHVAAVAVIVTISAINGLALATYTDAARPYIDSLVTWASVVTTWMVARRVIENWLYWIIIDAVAASLYFQQGRSTTGVLFVVYVGISIHGYRVWLRKVDAQQMETTAVNSAD